MYRRERKRRIKGVATAETGTDPCAAKVRVQTFPDPQLHAGLAVNPPGAQSRGQLWNHIHLDRAVRAGDRQAPDAIGGELNDRLRWELVIPSLDGLRTHDAVHEVLRFFAERGWADRTEAKRESAPGGVGVLNQRGGSKQDGRVGTITRIGLRGLCDSWREHVLRQVECQSLLSVPPQPMARIMREPWQIAGRQGNAEPDSARVVAVGTGQRVVLHLPCYDGRSIRRRFGAHGYGCKNAGNERQNDGCLSAHAAPMRGRVARIGANASCDAKLILVPAQVSVRCSNGVREDAQAAVNPRSLLRSLKAGSQAGAITYMWAGCNGGPIWHAQTDGRSSRGGTGQELTVSYNFANLCRYQHDIGWPVAACDFLF